MSDSATLTNGDTVHDSPLASLLPTPEPESESTNMANRTPTAPIAIPTEQRTHGWKTNVVREMLARSPRSTPAEVKRAFDELYPEDVVSLSTVIHAQKTDGKGRSKPRAAAKASETTIQTDVTGGLHAVAVAHAGQPVAFPTADGAEPTWAEFRAVQTWLRSNNVSASGIAGAVAQMAGLFGLGIAPAGVVAVVEAIAEIEQGVEQE